MKMTRRMRTLAVCGWLLGAVLGAAAWGEPIQPKGGTRYADPVACRVGDAVVVLVKDVTSVVQRVEAETRKDSTANAMGLGLLLRNFFASSFDNSSVSGTNAQNDNTAKFESSLSATVIKVKEGGNLVLQGKRAVVINGQRQELTVTGEARPGDLAADNSVPSSRLTNLSIDYQGPLRGKQRRGLLQCIMDVLF